MFSIAKAPGFYTDKHTAQIQWITVQVGRFRHSAGTAEGLFPVKSDFVPLVDSESL